MGPVEGSPSTRWNEEDGMAKVGEQTPVGAITDEYSCGGDRFLPVMTRHIELLGGETREQSFVDRRERTFVIVVSVTDEGQFLMIRQPKFGVMRYMLTFPTGGVKPGEAIYPAGVREVESEAGYRISQWHVATPDYSGTMVDMADKIDGGEHHVLFGTGARCIGRPEPWAEVCLVSREDLEKLVMGAEVAPYGRLEIANQIVAGMRGLSFLHPDKLQVRGRR